MSTAEECRKYRENCMLEIEASGDVPVRLEILDKKGHRVGYKIDTCWNLSQEPLDAKIHRLKNVGLEGHLARTLLGLFNSAFGNGDDSAYEGTWFRQHPSGVDLSVGSLRSNGAEIRRYRIERDGESFVLRE